MGWMTFEVPADLADHLILIYPTSVGDQATPVSIPLY